MNREAPVTAVQDSLHRRGRLRIPLYLLLVLVFLIGIVGAVLAVILLWQVSEHRTPRYAEAVEHFKYGSIGAEPFSGIPYRIWRALPKLFPEHFQGRDDYTAFGFLYENDVNGRPRDVPIGIARRVYRGIEVVWFNCATCHTGTISVAAGNQHASRRVIPGMPSNNLDLHRFLAFLLEAGADERLSPDRLITAINEIGPKLGPIEKALYRWYIIPTLREGLVLRRSRLMPLLAAQKSSWGPGRVDTFNPYKLIQAKMSFGSLEPKEIVGMADFPAIFQQGPRATMHLHWDGNNTSLAERNLSAAMGAGVTADSADHEAIERVAKWLLDLRPPPSPHQPESAAVARGQDIYMKACAACHGYQGAHGYEFKGERIGQVEPNAGLRVDPSRLDSYTEPFRAIQLSEFFKGTKYQFKEFRKTDGYANVPLDGLWLRAPYLHNGAVPTLADLLEPPEKRPKDFIRGIDTLDPHRGGFVAPPCNSVPLSAGAFCFDTNRPGNGNDGHLYGTDLSATEKSDLLAYLLTF